MSDNRERVKRLLVHYLRMATERGGGHWDYDNTSEIFDVVDLLYADMAAIAEQAARRHARESAPVQVRRAKDGLWK